MPFINDFPLQKYYSLFFKQITIQLLIGMVERQAITDKNEMDVNLSFLGEIFSRIVRRGSSGSEIFQAVVLDFLSVILFIHLHFSELVPHYELYIYFVK